MSALKRAVLRCDRRRTCKATARGKQSTRGRLRAGAPFPKWRPLSVRGTWRADYCAGNHGDDPAGKQRNKPCGRDEDEKNHAGGCSRVVRFDGLRESVPERCRRQDPANGGEAFAQPGCQDAAVGEAAGLGPSQAAKKKQKAQAAREGALREKRVVGSAHGVPSTKEGRMGCQRGEQAQGQRSRNLPLGHEGPFYGAARGDLGAASYDSSPLAYVALVG